MLLIPEEPVNNVRVSRGVVEEKVILNENVVTVKTEVVCSDSHDTIAVEANGDPRSHSPESRNGDVGGPGSVSGEGEGLGERAMMENGNGSDRVGNVKAETIAVDNHENMVLGASGGSGSNLPENGDGNIGASGIAMILVSVSVNLIIFVYIRLLVFWSENYKNTLVKLIMLALVFHSYFV
jgi:hypothetical protein